MVRIIVDKVAFWEATEETENINGKNIFVIRKVV